MSYFRNHGCQLHCQEYGCSSRDRENQKATGVAELREFPDNLPTKEQ